MKMCDTKIDVLLLQCQVARRWRTLTGHEDLVAVRFIHAELNAYTFIVLHEHHFILIKEA